MTHETCWTRINECGNGNVKMGRPWLVNCMYATDSLSSKFLIIDLTSIWTNSVRLMTATQLTQRRLNHQFNLLGYLRSRIVFFYHWHMDEDRSLAINTQRCVVNVLA